jgi:hypothetical protein
MRRHVDKGFVTSRKYIKYILLLLLVFLHEFHINDIVLINTILSNADFCCEEPNTLLLRLTPADLYNETFKVRPPTLSDRLCIPLSEATMVATPSSRVP